MELGGLEKTNMMSKKLAIFGTNGFGQEIYWTLPEEDRKRCNFFVSDGYLSLVPKETRQKYVVRKLSSLLSNLSEYSVIIAVGEPNERRRIVDSLPKDTNFGTYIHASAQIHDPNCKIGEGSIICANSIITTDVIIGKHSQININSSISNNCVIGDYFTCAPGVHILNHCTIGNNVYIGTNSSITEAIGICDDVIIGMQTSVKDSITEVGVYSGDPLKRIRQTKNPE